MEAAELEEMDNSRGYLREALDLKPTKAATAAHLHFLWGVVDAKQQRYGDLITPRIMLRHDIYAFAVCVFAGAGGLGVGGSIGRYAESRERFGRALELNPNHDDARKNYNALSQL